MRQVRFIFTYKATGAVCKTPAGIKSLNRNEHLFRICVVLVKTERKSNKYFK